MQILKIYIHANCQGAALAKLMAETQPDNVQVKCREVFSIDIQTEFENFRSDIEEADVIISQPVADNYRDVEWLSTDWLRRNRSPNSRLIIVPAIYHRGQIPQCFPLKDFYDGRLAYHDAHAIDYFLEGKDVNAFLHDTQRSDFFPPDFVRSEAFLTTRELLRRENTAGCNVLVSDIIERYSTTDQPLFTVNHPSRAVLAMFGNRMLDTLGVEWRIPSAGAEVLDQIVIAPYLSAAIAIGHEGLGLRLDEMRSQNTWESRAEYFAHVFDAYRAIGADRVRDAISGHGELTAYLQRFKRSKGAVQFEDRRKLVESLYRTFLGREPNSGEVLHHLQSLELRGFEALVTVFPNSKEFHVAGGGKALDARFPFNGD
ncbi:WcbI family polysaccharide biosynthesis putative acetyltransferase [Paraburkholderia sediminicola]|uniref:WcbI family polysaccharide biosynthesis putative acetyltransferase n=1 Tax=Paraburkholderia sediminicola TaxID=458836 RepID=UPI0038B9315E